MTANLLKLNAYEDMKRMKGQGSTPGAPPISTKRFIPSYIHILSSSSLFAKACIQRGNHSAAHTVPRSTLCGQKPIPPLNRINADVSGKPDELSHMATHSRHTSDRTK